MNKKKSRIKRAKRTRIKLIQLEVNRLLVHRTSRHIYAQILNSKENKVLVSASTLEKNIFNKLNYNTSNKKSANIVGKNIAKRALKKGIINVSFDRSGFKYHGRVKILAESAREYGLKF